MPRSPWLAAALCLPAGCFSSPDQQQVQSSAGCSTAACRGSTGRPHGGASGGGTSGSSGGGGASTGGTTTGTASGTGGTTTGGSSGGSSSGGGTTGGVTCGACYDPAVPLSQYLACQGQPPCANAICAQVCDVFQTQAVCGMNIQELDSNGAQIQGQNLSTTTNASDGTFLLCPASVPFTVSASVSGYQATYSAQFVAGGVNVPQYFSDGLGSQFPVFSTTVFASLAAGFNAGNTQDSLISVSMASSCEPLGFRISAELPDGGTLPDGGPLQAQVQYVQDFIPNQSLNATDDGGTAIVTLDPSQTSGFVALVATPVDVPSGCPTSIDYASYGMTGLVYVTPGSYSFTLVPVR